MWVWVCELVYYPKIDKCERFHSIHIMFCLAWFGITIKCFNGIYCSLWSKISYTSSSTIFYKYNIFVFYIFLCEQSNSLLHETRIFFDNFSMSS